MEAVKQYEVWWASLPQPAGRRPVLLLSRETAYSYLDKFVAVEITSTVGPIAVEVPLGRQAETGRGSRARVGRIDRCPMMPAAPGRPERAPIPLSVAAFPFPVLD